MNILLENTVNHKGYHLNCLKLSMKSNYKKWLLIFNFIGERTESFLFANKIYYADYIVCKYAKSVQSPMNLKIKTVIP